MLAGVSALYGVQTSALVCFWAQFIMLAVILNALNNLRLLVLGGPSANPSDVQNEGPPTSVRRGVGKHL